MVASTRTNDTRNRIRSVAVANKLPLHDPGLADHEGKLDGLQRVVQRQLVEEERPLIGGRREVESQDSRCSVRGLAALLAATTPRRTSRSASALRADQNSVLHLPCGIARGCAIALGDNGSRERTRAATPIGGSEEDMLPRLAAPRCSKRGGRGQAHHAPGLLDLAGRVPAAHGEHAIGRQPLEEDAPGLARCRGRSRSRSRRPRRSRPRYPRGSSG